VYQKRFLKKTVRIGASASGCIARRHLPLVNAEMPFAEISASGATVFSMLARQASKSAEIGGKRSMDVLRKQHATASPSSYAAIDPAYARSVEPSRPPISLRREEDFSTPPWAV
jgi:hypothetical protein